MESVPEPERTWNLNLIVILRTEKTRNFLAQSTEPERSRTFILSHSQNQKDPRIYYKARNRNDMKPFTEKGNQNQTGIWNLL